MCLAGDVQKCPHDDDLYLCKKHDSPYWVLLILRHRSRDTTNISNGTSTVGRTTLRRGGGRERASLPHDDNVQLKSSVQYHSQSVIYVIPESAMQLIFLGLAKSDIYLPTPCAVFRERNAIFLVYLAKNNVMFYSRTGIPSTVFTVMIISPVPVPFLDLMVNVIERWPEKKEHEWLTM